MRGTVGQPWEELDDRIVGDVDRQTELARLTIERRNKVVGSCNNGAVCEVDGWTFVVLD